MDHALTHQFILQGAVLDSIRNFGDFNMLSTNQHGSDGRSGENLCSQHSKFSKH